MITSMRGCVLHNDLWPWPISSRSFSLDFAIKLLQYGASCRVRSTACTVLDGFFPYLAQMITGMRGCVVHNDLWPWPLSFRSFSHNFAIKLLKYGTFCCVCSTACTVLDGAFPYLAQMVTSMRGCVMCNDLSPSPISSRTFSHDFAVKLLEYSTSCIVHSTAHTVLDYFFPLSIFTQMITSMRGCVACSHLWIWPMSSRNDGYLAVMSIHIIIFIFDTNTTHEGMMCLVPFPGQ